MELSEIEEKLADNESVTWQGYEDALTGHTESGEFIAVYEWGKCIEVLMIRDGMAYDGAVEFFSHNITLGDKQPVVVNTGYEPQIPPKGTLAVRQDEYLEKR